MNRVVHHTRGSQSGGSGGSGPSGSKMRIRAFPVILLFFLNYQFYKKSSNLETFFG